MITLIMNYIFHVKAHGGSLLGEAKPHKLPNNVHLWFYNPIGCQINNSLKVTKNLLKRELNQFKTKKLLPKFSNYGRFYGPGNTYLDQILLSSNNNNNNSSVSFYDSRDNVFANISVPDIISLSEFIKKVTPQKSNTPIVIIVDSCRTFFTNKNYTNISPGKYSHNLYNQNKLIEVKKFEPSARILSQVNKSIFNENNKSERYLQKYGFVKRYRPRTPNKNLNNNFDMSSAKRYRFNNYNNINFLL